MTAALTGPVMVKAPPIDREGAFMSITAPCIRNGEVMDIETAISVDAEIIVRHGPETGLRELRLHTNRFLALAATEFTQADVALIRAPIDEALAKHAAEIAQQERVANILQERDRNA